jgi:chromosome segregation ATPase
MNMKTNRKKKTVIPVVFPLFMIASLVIASGSCKSKTAQNSGDITQEDVKEEFEEAVDTSVAYFTQERKELMDAYESKVEAAEQQIQELKTQIDSTEVDVSQDFREKVQLLESQAAYVRNNINELEESAANAWKELSVGVDTALVNLDRAIQDAKEEFQKS